MLSDMVAGRYVLVAAEPPRHGGHSVIRKAVDVKSGGYVALKLFSVGSDELEKKIFDREVDALRGVDHANIVKLIDAGSDDGTLFVALEWVETSLAEAQKMSGPQEWESFLSDVLEPLASAVSHLHLRQREHRDIKPGNILLDDKGRLVLADFGIGKERRSIDDSNLTVQSFRSGIFAPPEVEDTIHYVRDVYSIGVVAIQSLYAERITSPNDLLAALDAIPVPTEYKNLLKACIDLDATRRPANGAVVHETLREIRHASRADLLVGLNPALLILTDLARSQIVGEDGYVDRATRLAIDDLKGETFVSYRWDSETLSRDRDVIFLIGQSRRYTLRLDRDPGGFTVTAAPRLSFEELEMSRRRGMRADETVAWALRPALNRAVHERARAFLIAALDSHNELVDAAESSSTEVSDAGRLIDIWRRVLNARHDLARGQHKSLKFVSSQARDRDFVVDLAVAPEGDLIGSEWEWASPDGSGWRHRAEVIAQSGGSLTLRWRSGGKPVVSKSGTLSPFLGATQYALQRQHEALNALESRVGVRSDLIDMLASPGTAKEPIRVESPLAESDLDSQKQEALEKGLGLDDLLVVEGPPGTGKTRFITELIRAKLSAEPTARILLVSQTHAAVDNALERLDRAGLDRVVRIGHAGDPRIATATRHLMLDTQMSKWAAQLRKKAEDRMNHLALDGGLDARHLRAVLRLEELAAVVRQQVQVGELIADAESGEASSELATGLGLTADVSDLSTRLERLSEQYEDARDAALLEIGSDLTLRHEMDLDDIDAASGALLGPAQNAPELLRITKLQAEWLQRVVSDENLAAAFLQTARVIAGTCIGFVGLRAARMIEFDLCIVDEASKATATEAVVPLARARSSILVGDLNQLPPLDEDLLRRKDLLEEFDLDTSDIKETLFERLSEFLPTSAKVALTDQYRMVPAIGDLISDCFYEGALVSRRPDRLDGYLSLGQEVLWIDTAPLGTTRREDRALNSSFANRAEAAVVMKRLSAIEGAIDKGVITIPSSRQRLSVLLIAPYRGQVEELNRRLASWHGKHLDIAVESIDAVQGREADLVILSLTRSNPDSRFGFIGSAYWRRLNVALSRARYGLSIVGDAAFAESKPGALQNVLNYIRSHPANCELRAADV